MKKRAILALADGTTFEGVSFGATGEATGEAVFNTSVRDRRAERDEPLGDRHGPVPPVPGGRALEGRLQKSGKPARRRRSAVSASGSPTTFETLPSTDSTKAPPAPWIAYAPALSSGSPVPMYQSISPRVRRAKRTFVATTASSSSASARPRRTHTA